MTSLGFNQRQIRSVMNYRSKGGIYRQVQQMSKISGMTKGQYDRLAPYFRVSQDYLPASQFVTIPKYPYSAPKQQQQPTTIRTTPIVSEAPALDKPTSKIKPGETIDLNSADTTDLKRIPGVGSAFAKMIINYRNRLGGFYSISQLNDLQALPTDVHQYATIAEQPNIRKLKINTLSINQLVNHPYINYYKARAITEYTRLKGKITDIRELQLNRNFTPNDIQRLAPYLDYE
ncbi:MAG: helix-hairpin-helix domain-containing protein [Bacteroidaceae bacterium]|nr:helix-hairpin-helix domain-containing protein [Bacteroidaceae bacterium]